jgi:hypothetical protein
VKPSVEKVEYEEAVRKPNGRQASLYFLKKPWEPLDVGGQRDIMKGVFDVSFHEDTVTSRPYDHIENRVEGG